MGGRLVTVDAGSTILDVLTELQTSQILDVDCEEKMQVYRNGGTARLHDKVNSGDMLLLHSESSPGTDPTRENEWLERGNLVLHNS